MSVKYKHGRVGVRKPSKHGSSRDPQAWQRGYAAGLKVGTMRGAEALHELILRIEECKNIRQVKKILEEVS